MLKESKNIDFYTTGRQPSEQDFLRISEWIRKNRKNDPKKNAYIKPKTQVKVSLDQKKTRLRSSVAIGLKKTIKAIKDKTLCNT